MRRRFNIDLCPKSPPKGDWRTKNQGSEFNQWFRGILKQHKIKMKYFCAISGSNYQTAMGWRYKSNPHIHGKIEIAKGLEKLGVGKFAELLKIIKSKCR